MKSLFTKYIWLQFILSILLLFGGALIIAFAIKDNDGALLENGLNIIAAIILFLFGAFAILASFAFEANKVITNGLLYGSACIALGVFLCMKEAILLNYLVYLLAIFFIVIGGVELIKGIILVVKKYPKLIGVIITFVVAAIFIAGGILALIFHDDVKIAFCIVAGALIFAAGAYLLVLGVIDIVGHAKINSNKPARRSKNKGKPKNDAQKNEVVVQEEPQEQEIKEIDFTKKEEN